MWAEAQIKDTRVPGRGQTATIQREDSSNIQTLVQNSLFWRLLSHVTVTCSAPFAPSLSYYSQNTNAFQKPQTWSPRVRFSDIMCRFSWRRTGGPPRHTETLCAFQLIDKTGRVKEKTGGVDAIPWKGGRRPATRGCKQPRGSWWNKSEADSKDLNTTYTIIQVYWIWTHPRL